MSYLLAVVRLACLTLVAPLLVVGWSVALAPAASAHRDGCHSQHSCPSDSGSYVCGDKGNFSECGGAPDPAPTYTAPEPAPVVDLDPPRRPRLERVTASARGAVALALVAERGARLVVRDGPRIVLRTTATGARQALRLTASTGRHRYAVMAIDTSGNESTVARTSVVADATPPTSGGVAVTSPTAEDSRLGLELTTDPGTRFRVLLDGTEVARGTSTDGRIAKSAHVSNGSHAWSVQLRDTVGNLRTISRMARVSVTSLRASVVDRSEAGDATQTFHVAGTPGGTGTLNVLGGPSRTFRLGPDGADVEVPLRDGRYAGLRVVVSDPTGRRGSARAGRFVVDTVAPALRVKREGHYLRRGVFAATVAAERGARVLWRVRNAAGDVVARGRYVSDGTDRLLRKDVGEGTFRLQAAATDAAGNVEETETDDVQVSPAPLTPVDLVIGSLVLVVFLILLVLAGWAALRVLRGRRRRRAEREAERQRAQVRLAHARSVSAYEAKMRQYAADTAEHRRLDLAWSRQREELLDLADLATSAQWQPVTAAVRTQFKLRKDERVLGSPLTAQMIELRTRQGHRHIEGLGHGEVLVTEDRFVFAGDRRRDWTWEKLEDLQRDGSQVLLKVANRQKYSGVRAQAAERSAVLLDIALVDLAGEGTRERVAEGVRETVRLHDERRPRPPAHPGPPPVPPVEWTPPGSGGTWN